MGPLQSGSHTMHHLSSQIYRVDAHVRKLIAGLPTSPPGASTSSGSKAPPSMEDLVKEQKELTGKMDDINTRLENMSRKQ